MPNPIFVSFLAALDTLENDINRQMEPAGNADKAVFNQLRETAREAIRSLREVMSVEGWGKKFSGPFGFLPLKRFASGSGGFSSKMKRGLMVSGTENNITLTDPESRHLAVILKKFLENNSLPLTGSHAFVSRFEQETRKKRVEQLNSMIEKYDNPHAATTGADLPRTPIEAKQAPAAAPTKSVTTSAENQKTSNIKHLLLQAAAKDAVASINNRVLAHEKQLSSDSKAAISLLSSPELSQLAKTDMAKIQQRLSQLNDLLEKNIEDCKTFTNNLTNHQKHIAEQKQIIDTKLAALESGLEQRLTTNLEEDLQKGKLIPYDASLAKNLGLSNAQQKQWKDATTPSDSKLSRAVVFTSNIAFAAVRTVASTAFGADLYFLEGPVRKMLVTATKTKLDEIAKLREEQIACSKELTNTKDLIREVQTASTAAEKLQVKVKEIQNLHDYELFTKAAKNLLAHIDSYLRSETGLSGSLKKIARSITGNSFIHETRVELLQQLRNDIVGMLPKNKDKVEVSASQDGKALLAQLHKHTQKHKDFFKSSKTITKAIDETENIISTARTKP